MDEYDFLKKLQSWAISGFRPEVDGIWDLLGFDATYGGISLPT
jgi:hypothetical protein